MEADAREHEALKVEKVEEKARFDVALQSKDAVILNLRESARKFTAALERIPVLEHEADELKAKVLQLEAEKALLYTADQCRDQYWEGILGCRRMFAKHMPDFQWAKHVPLWLEAEDNLVECQADRDDAAKEREEAAKAQQARKVASEGDTTAGTSSPSALQGRDGDVP